MTPRGPDKQFDRDQVLDRAVELFWEQGYEATGVTELLDHMGIGRQSMYDTFGNKRELFLAALRRYAAGLSGRIAKQLAAPGSPLENIRNVFAMWEDMATGNDHHGCFVGNSIAELGCHDPEVAAALHGAIGMTRAAFADAILRAQEAGEVSRDLDPQDLASLLVASSQGAALMTKIDGGEEIGRGVLRAAVQLLESGR